VNSILEGFSAGRAHEKGNGYSTRSVRKVVPPDRRYAKPGSPVSSPLEFQAWTGVMIDQARSEAEADAIERILQGLTDLGANKKWIHKEAWRNTMLNALEMYREFRGGHNPDQLQIDLRV